MKANSREKLKMSVMRTIVAGVVLLSGIKLGNIAINWQQWTSVNSDVGLLMVILMYIGAFFGIIYGVYLISPIYTSIFMNGVIKLLLLSTRLEDMDDEEEKEEMEEEKNFQDKISKFREKYLW